jgi:hypothetical protein
VTVDGWFHSRKASIRDAYVEEAIKAGIKKETALKEAARHAEEKLLELKTKLFASSDRLDSCNSLVKDYSEEIAKIHQNLANITDPKNLGPLTSKLDAYQRLYASAIKEQDMAIKEIQSLSDTNDPNIVKSDLSELFNNLIDNYTAFLSTLSSEQMVIVFNLIGYSSLLINVTSITTLLIGDQLINSLKLEIRYPKFAKYIKLKQTLNKHYLRFYIALFYIQLFLLISINIWMFFIEYFL